VKGKNFLIAISAILLVLSFPNFNLWFLAWIGLVPLLLAIDGEKPKQAFLFSYFTGAIFLLGTIYWLIHVTFPGMFLVVLYLALYFGLFGLFVSRIQNQDPLQAIFTIPAAWVTSEWLRSNILTGFGWNLLGYSQSSNLPVIQIADATGIYGVSFLVVMANTAIFLAIKYIGRWRYIRPAVALAVMLLLVSLAYGYFRLNVIFIGDRLRIGIVQGNIAQDKKWDANFKEYILGKYERLTKELAKEKADLIIWPETAVPAYWGFDSDISDRIRHLSLSVKTPLLVGAPRVDEVKNGAYYNSAILLSEDGQVTGVYDKVHLVPFGEYIPAKIIFSFVEQFAPSPIGDFTRGEDLKILKFVMKRASRTKDVSLKIAKKIKFSCLICFEDIFPELSRISNRKGAYFLVNMTNDAWFGRSSAPYQHAQSSVFRAVENRTNVIRATNTGFSCFVDQKGRITDKIGKSGNFLFVDGYKIGEIVVGPSRTFYNIYGDIFAYICMCLVLFYGIINFKRYLRMG